MSGNVRGANRTSFADRFRRMCSSQKIDLCDLWPMHSGPASLSAVRNRIVHGRVFSSDQEWFRVISAKHHLQRTLERGILCILGGSSTAVWGSVLIRVALPILRSEQGPALRILWSSGSLMIFFSFVRQDIRV